jgi:hypothetical protein
VAKVKKRAALTGVRNVSTKGKAQRATSATRPTGKAKSRVTRGGARSRPANGKGVRGTKAKRGQKPALTLASARKGRPVAAPPVVRVTVRELDPQRKCGAGTSVQMLFRVDEMVEGRASAHLVFFDRHGWYCEHGRSCPAVAHARKQSGHIARVSS